jgi:putative thioredoxin
MSLPPSAKGLGNFGGAFDLGTLRQPAVAIDPADLGYVVTQHNLVSELLPASNEAVAIILCWSPRSTQAQSLLPMMRQFNRDDATATGEPTWIFGSVNVDAEPAVAKALQVQSVPLAIAIIQEQLVPLFESVPPADQVRAVINKVLELAAQKGVGVAPVAPADPVDVIEPEEEAAMAALQAGDYLGAKRSYEEWLKRSPNNDFAKLGLAQVELFIRIDGVDPVDAAKQADAHPEDLAMQIMAADCEIAQGNFEGATSRLISAVRNSAGDDRKRVRDHLLILFTLIEPDDPRLAKARQQLASALF